MATSSANDGASLVLFCTKRRIGSTSTNENRKAQILPAHFHKDVRSDNHKDPFSIDLIVAVVGGKPCVQFEGYSPVTTHQSSFTATAKFINANTLSFNFIDDWGTKGKGTITLSRQNALARFTKIAPSTSGVDAAESWPQNEIIPKVKLHLNDLLKKCCHQTK